MKKETVHLVASVLWGIYGITVGSIGVIHNNFNTDVMVSIVVAISGNSAHLISMSLSKTGLAVNSENQKVS